MDPRTILRESVLEIHVRPGREACLESFETPAQDGVDRLNRLAVNREQTSADGGPHHGAGR